MKRLQSYTLVITVTIISFFSYIQSSARTRVSEERHLSVTVRNIFTGGYITDTLHLDLLLPDSSLVTSRDLKIKHDSWRGDNNMVSFVLKNPSTKFLLRISHPDYETTYYPVDFDKLKNDRYLNVSIRKLTKREKEGIMLDEVTVNGTVLEFINKGDTIQFNAAAFELAEGSMLSALIQKLPGAELKENGQIYINGRFIDKLLLDGKDFFKGNNLVLLQNLPAYTVKNIQVYEEKTREQLAQKGSKVPDLVMDVRLKKEFNAGWLANVEASGGTHDRYRLRGFLLGYKPKGRVSAYAYMNNLNEISGARMSGDWYNPQSKTNVSVVKGGGIEYFLQPNSNIQLNGNATVRYTTTFGNTLTNRQNYLPGGDTYQRRWNDSHVGSLNIFSYHDWQFKRVKLFNDLTFHEIWSQFLYGSDHRRNSTVEGTFDHEPGSYPSMRDELKIFMPDTLGIMNRYLNLQNSSNKSASGELSYKIQNWYNHASSFTLRIFGKLEHQWNDMNQQYLLQYAGRDPNITDRTNPRNAHSSEYGLHFRYDIALGHGFDLRPSYDVSNKYNYSSTRWYDLAQDIAGTWGDIAAMPLFSRLENMERELDERNSYSYGLHNLEQNPAISLSYYTSTVDEEGNNNDEFQFSIDPGLKYLRRKMIFDGMTHQIISKNTVMPEVNFYLRWLQPKMRHRIVITYRLSGNEPRMTDYIDMHFNSDPLNPTFGNPNLKYSFMHDLSVKYSTNYKIWSIFDVSASLRYNVTQRDIAMSSEYDRATGVRTTKPVNINGNRFGSFMLHLTATPERSRKLSIYNSLQLTPRRYVDMISTDPQLDAQKCISHSFAVEDRLSISYKLPCGSVGLEGDVRSNHVNSRSGDFNTYTLTNFSYGATTLIRLPLNFEISTNLRMYSTRGYTESSMNTNRLIWNGKVSKSLIGGSLQLAVEAYDILQRYKNINYSITSQYRQETYTNFVPSYVLFCVRWFFAKKPRQ